MIPFDLRIAAETFGGASRSSVGEEEETVILWKKKRVGNTDQPLMHSLMSISSEYYVPICHFQGSFWIFNSSAMWLYSWVTNFVVELSLEGEPLLADCHSSLLSQIYPDMTALLRAATQICLWDFQTAIHILPVLNTFYFRSVYPGLAQLCIAPHLCCWNSFGQVDIKLEEHSDKIGFLLAFSGHSDYLCKIRMNRHILFQIAVSACILHLFWILEAFKYLLYVSEHPYWITLIWFFPQKTGIKWPFSQQ